MTEPKTATDAKIKSLDADAEERLTSVSLIEGLMASDSVYWERLDVLYGPIISYWIERAGVPQGSVSDVRQEVMIAVSKNLDTYIHQQDRSGTLRRWIWGISRNKIADFFQAERRQQTAAGGTEAFGRLANLPAEPFEDAEPQTANRLQNGLVLRALGILRSDFKESTWKAFWMTTVEEKQGSEVAEALGLSEAAVRQARYRVLQRLRAELGQDFPM